MSSGNNLIRDLKNRHIQLIAFGGAIGTGLFYGSAPSVMIAGPSVLIAYFIAGFIVLGLMRALGEMAVEEPIAGSFSTYAYKYVGKFAGFFSGWNYWFATGVAMVAELSVAGIYVQFWWPEFPMWLTALIAIVVFASINILSVKYFGEMEFWFALIKVVAIIAMIVFGLIIIFTGIGNGGEPVGLSNLWAHGGFFPNGFGAMLLSVVLVIIGFGGVEVVGITAGEAQNPEKTIPKAINGVFFRILIFYVGAMFVIVTLTPWTEIGMGGSPFVQIFDSIGIAFAASLLNFVVLTATLSAFNSQIYTLSRMLFGLSEKGNAPKVFLKINKRGVPFAGVFFSTGIAALGLILLFFVPEKAFMYSMSMALFAGLANWILIFVTQLRFRKRMQDRIGELKLKMPLFPAWSYLSIGALVCIILGFFFIPDFRYALILGPLWILSLYVAYRIKTKNEIRLTRDPGAAG